MTWLSVCLFFVVFAFVGSTSFNEVDLQLYEEPPKEEPKKDGDKCDAESLNNIICENDRLQFCGPNNEIISTPCVLNRKPAFCNCEKTGCVPQKPICSDETTECLLPNTKLPDNSDCHKFTYCNKNKQKSTLKCPIDLIYDPKTEKCLDRTKAQCNRVICPRSSNSLQLIPFPQAKNYYVLCYNGIGDVRKCSDEFYGVRNNICQFDCNLKGTSGVFKDSNVERCKKGFYYGCKKSGGNYITVQAKCSPGLTFDEKIGLCTEEDTCTEANKS